MKLYAFDVDDTLNVSNGPVRLAPRSLMAPALACSVAARAVKYMYHWQSRKRVDILWHLYGGPSDSHPDVERETFAASHAPTASDAASFRAKNRDRVRSGNERY